MNEKHPVESVRVAWTTEPGSPTLPYLVPRYRISLVREAEAVTESPVFRDAASAVRVLRPYFEGLDREQFLVCCLDAGHAMIGVNVVSVGSLTISIVHPREVLKPAILLNAGALVGGRLLQPRARADAAAAVRGRHRDGAPLPVGQPGG